MKPSTPLLSLIHIFRSPGNHVGLRSGVGRTYLCTEALNDIPGKRLEVRRVYATEGTIGEPFLDLTCPGGHVRFGIGVGTTDFSSETFNRVVRKGCLL